MTGFARVAIELENQTSYSLTLKSVNHRFLDLHLRLPSGFDALEMELRRLLKEHLRRGHVEVTLSVDRSASSARAITAISPPPTSRPFSAAAQEFALQGQPDLNVILRMPGVLQAETRSSSEDVARRLRQRARPDRAPCSTL